MKKILFGLLAAILLGTMTTAFCVRQLNATETIYIRSDGSIDPPTASIQRNGTTYTFIGGINGSIVVQKSDIVIDGSGHALEGRVTGRGVSMSGLVNVTIKNLYIRSFDEGIFVEMSSSCSFCGNEVTMSYSIGIHLFASSGINIRGNNISSNKNYGILFETSSGNNVSKNNLQLIANSHGARLLRSSYNDFSWNNIIGGSYGIELDEALCNSLSENKIETNAYSGITLDVSSYNNVTRNEIASNRQAGIWLLGSGTNGSDYNRLTANNVTKNMEGGIVVSGPSHGNIVSENNLAANNRGIWLFGASGNVVSENNLMENIGGGVVLEESSSNDVLGNTMRTNYAGVGVYTMCSYNNFLENNIADNTYGIVFERSSDNNTVCHNNFLNNTNQAYVRDSMNVWDDGSCGNYWSDYDGMGDAPYIIDSNNVDRFPRLVPIGTMPVFWNQQTFYCLIAGNMTVSRFAVEEDKTLVFKTIGHGWVNLTIPKELSSGTFRVFINNTETLSFASWNKEHTNTSIYFECKTSGSNEVKIEAEMRLLGDINGDGAVNIIDISMVAKHFGQNLNP